MKKLILILLISLNVFPKNYTVDELLSLYEKNSSLSKENEININQYDLKKEEILNSSRKDLSLEFNPNVMSKDKENTYIYSLNATYRNFSYKLSVNKNSDKLSENITYKNSLYGAFFEESINKKTSYVTVEIDELKNRKVFIDQKKAFVEKIYLYLSLLENLKIYEESLKESLKEKEILEKKELLGESVYLENLNNENETISLENNITYINSQAKNLSQEIISLTGITGDFFIENRENKFELNKNNLNLSILEKNLNLIETQIKKEKFKPLQNLNFSYEYNIEEKSNIASLSYIYRPFEDKSDKQLLKMDKEKLLLQSQEEKRTFDKETLDKINKHDYLQEEYTRNRDYLNRYREYYENYKKRFEANQISYTDYLKIKKEFREIQKSFINSHIELEKFKILASN